MCGSLTAYIYDALTILMNGSITIIMLELTKEKCVVDERL